MQVIVYENDQGVTFTLNNTIKETTHRIAVIHTLEGADAFIGSGAYPVFQNMPQKSQSFEMVCDFFTQGHAALGAASRDVHTYLSTYLTASKKNVLPVGLVYNHFVAVTGNPMNMTQAKFTRAVNKTQIFSIRVSTVNKKCTRVICNADFKNC